VRVLDVHGFLSASIRQRMVDTADA
jgi:hypothetical protein